MLMDAKALQYVLSKYEKTPVVNFALRGIVGEGVSDAPISVKVVLIYNRTT